MKYPLIFGSALFLVVNLTRCECKTEIGGYIVDCSACNSIPVQGVSSYSCKIRCDLQGKYLCDFYIQVGPIPAADCPV